MSSILETAREVLSIEAEGITRLMDRLDGSFEKTVQLILESPGKVITSGIGKSGIVARKIMATMNSTGTTAIFLHPVEALHGDLGMVNRGDVVLALSHSGQTEELVNLVPQLKEHGAMVVAMTGGLDSALARVSDVVVDCGVEREACPLGLAPTASTTAALAMGDALSVVLINKRHFKAEDFRFHHPGGNLGQRLSLKVRQVMIPLPATPMVGREAGALDAVDVINRGDLGAVLIADAGRLAGILTDGDLRRALLAGVDLSRAGVADIMTKAPRSIGPETLSAEALHLMEERLITVLPILDEEGMVLGVVHLHDLLGRGSISLNGLSQHNRDK